MGQRGTRYSLEDKLYYIHLVEQGQTTTQIERQYGVNHNQVRQWIERYQAEGRTGLNRRHFQKYPLGLKQKVVKLYLAGGTSYPQLARQFGISNPSVIYQWVNLYTSGKSLKTTGRSKTMNTGRKTTQKERIEIAQWAIANSLDYNAAVQQFQVSYGQVYAWVKKFKQGGPEALQDRRGKDKSGKPQLTEVERQELKVKALEARIAYLSKENEVLKKMKELERKDAPQRLNTAQSKRSPKKP